VRVVALPDNPVMIVVGGDALALSTARELCALQGHRVALLWRGDAEFGRAVEEVGAAFIAGQPDTPQTLARAGVAQAVTILALSRDDQLNLHTALLARDANSAIRIVLRQFNRRLARKIEQNLPDCSVLSLAWHSAATYAAAAIDPACFRGLQFPEPDGPLTGIAARNAETCGVDGLSVAQAETMLSARILAVDGVIRPEPGLVIGGRAELAIFAPLGDLQRTSPRLMPARPRSRRFQLIRWRHRRHGRLRPNPILIQLALAALGIFVLGAVYFHAVFGDTWLDAAYFVIATMTTTGYGDVTPDRGNPFEIIAAILLMLTGVTLTGIFIAFGASLLVRVHWVTLQGLRPVHRRGHIIVCGAGSIGAGVIELLLGLGKRLVVIEQTPDTAIVELARQRRFDLLTGDASRDETLDLCNLGAAHSLVALTNVDTLNLEIGLGARARNPTMPIVMRIAEASFAASIARHFEFETTFSVAALAAPTFVGLSRFAGSRGRVVVAGQEFAIGEYTLDENARPAPPANAILLALARDDDFMLADDTTQQRAGDRVLIMLPMAPFRAGEDNFAAAAERFLQGG
jgi:Trk K+ transport system NAD-binding subunit